MHKIVPSFLSLAFTFSFVAPDAQAVPPSVNPVMLECSTPKPIGKAWGVDWNHNLVSFNGVKRIYFQRLNSLGGINQVEINPGTDGLFGTRDDRKRDVRGMINRVYEDVVIMESGGKDVVIKPGPDNVLFTADDSEVVIPNSMDTVKNGDMLAWFDPATSEIKACDLTISSGRGSCAEDTNHWAVSECAGGRCLGLIDPFDANQLLYPTKQVVHGRVTPMVIGLFHQSTTSNRPAAIAIMMENGFRFPLSIPLDPDRTYGFGIRGNLIFAPHEDALGNAQLGIISIDVNSPAFLTRRDTPIGSDYFVSVDSSVNNRSVMPAYLYTDDGLGSGIYKDESRNLTAKLVSAKDSVFIAQEVKGNLVLGYMLPSSGNIRAAVSVCP
jgi:hypothetical protein